MAEKIESADFGPCGWPSRTFGNSQMGCLDGIRVDGLLSQSDRIGDVSFSGLARPIPAYSACIDGNKIRFAFDEFQQGHYVLASNDAEISVEDY